MLNRQDDSDARRQQLSALMDGEADPADWARTCAGWRHDPAMRADWHVYHLIGDALRSDELTSQGQHDEAFLSALRGRLAAEPVPLAPAQQGRTAATLPAAAVAAAEPALQVVNLPTTRRRSHWLMAPAAAAAGFVAVAGVLVVLRGTGAGTGAPDATPMAVALPEPAHGVMPVTSTLIRDSRLDGYLAAHRRVPLGVSMAVPGGMARTVDTYAIDAK